MFEGGKMWFWLETKTWSEKPGSWELLPVMLSEERVSLHLHSTLSSQGQLGQCTQKVYGAGVKAAVQHSSSNSPGAAILSWPWGTEGMFWAIKYLCRSCTWISGQCRHLLWDRPEAQTHSGWWFAQLLIMWSLQIGPFNPSYEKIFRHFQNVKYKGEWLSRIGNG